MVKKVFGTKSITHLIYGLLMLMPFAAIGVKSAYTIVNKNAYQSYTNTQIEQVNLISNQNDLISGVDYINTYKPTTGVSQQARIIKFNSISIDWQSLGFTNRNYTSYFTLNDYFYAYYDNYTDNDHREIRQVWGTTLTSFTINFNSIIDGGGDINRGNNQYYMVNYVSQKLDNVFYYAVDEIIKDNNIGLIDFTSWFNGLVLPSNQVNNRFIGYANWYMNYAILISCVYILFLCLLWFVNFARKLLDRGMNYDF